jgi:ribosomal-protein-serine acetyltransferase
METELSDGNISIRPFRADDVDAVFEAVRESINELSPWMQWCHPDYSRDETRAFITSRPDDWSTDQAYTFAIVDARTGAFLGSVGLNFINRLYKMANLGYWVRTGSTQRGVASAATRLIAIFGFREAGFQRLEIVAAVGNRSSQRTAEKAGATREGVLRKRLIVNHQPQDAVLYSLVAEDLLEGMRVEG